MGAEIAYTAVASLIAAAISAVVALRSKRADILMAASANNSIEIQHIFDGYARIVEDLQNEVLRLQAELDILRAEQKECDDHRAALAEEVLELKKRILLLEEAQVSNDREEFEQLIKQIIPDRLITNFILIAEIVDGDNEELSVNVSNGMTPWLAIGMLQYGEEMIRSRENELSDEEDD